MVFFNYIYVFRACDGDDPLILPHNILAHYQINNRVKVISVTAKVN